MGSELIDLHVDLLGQSPRRSDDEGADLAARTGKEALQDREHKCGGLACACRARPMTSLPSSAFGIACIWIGVAV